jgi:hypothetical protein
MTRSLALASAAAFALFCFAAAPAQAQLSCPDPFSTAGANCAPLTSSATGTTAATVATLAASSTGKTTYICGFYFTGTNATAANPATTLTITGTIGGTLNFGFPTLAAAATVPNSLPLDEEFIPCVAASAPNTAIVVNGPALGAGATLATVTAWGYQR